MSIWKTVTTASVVLGAILLWTPVAHGFQTYTSGCSGCHPGFVDGFGSETHDLHLQMTDTCTNCHGTPGDDPQLNKCAGCHVAFGVRAHHRNAGTSTCGATSCHPSDGTPATEDTVPPYFGMVGVNIDHPCFVDPEGTTRGEDFDGDGKGLDNDGDLAYEADDSDCDAVPTIPSTWGLIKSLF